MPCSPALKKLAKKPTTHHPKAAALLLDLLLFKPDLQAAPINFSPDLTWSEVAAWKPPPPVEDDTDEVMLACKTYKLPPKGNFEAGPYVHI